MVRLQPAGTWDVRGAPAETDWHYRVDEFGPSGNMSFFVSSASVVHARYAYEASIPWRGVGPLQWAKLSGQLISRNK